MTNEILVIDDNSDIRQLISGILKDKDYLVREAANFDQAMLEINKKLPDVAIVDVKLDKGDNDGIELLVHLKKIKNADFKGKITVDIKEDSDYIYVTIVDDGVGFKKVDKAKIFTPYYTTKKKGSGLGLAIVAKIISDHNGSILFNSIKDGARVEITLPKYYG